ncbi:hypothetical protein H9P43_005634 [Blastocladiella emersonii ATCC 22665]|nr:hypothetical protein H9P43_005634 [Blastocladiella emersonii ATCC 22665]
MSTSAAMTLFGRATAAATAPAPSLLGSILSRLAVPAPLAGLVSGILWAVPKSRTTHGKKRMRMSNKGLKNLENITACPVCKGPKLLHNVCPGCLARLERRRNEVLRKD